MYLEHLTAENLSQIESDINGYIESNSQSIVNFRWFGMESIPIEKIEFENNNGEINCFPHCNNMIQGVCVNQYTREGYPVMVKISDGLISVFIDGHESEM